MSETQPLKSTQGSASPYFLNTRQKDKAAMEISPTEEPSTYSKSFWNALSFRRRDHSYSAIDNVMDKPRKVPVKIEPKVFFANERTFLAWLHMSVTLASISIAIVAFADANEWSQLYGLLLMPVAIAFCIYSLYMYISRARMIRRKDPGPYEDRVGPVVLASFLSLAILVNFVIKIYDYSR